MKTHERIKELAEQAHVYADGHSLLCHEGDIKKFAELIVRECTRIVVNNGIATATHDQMVRQDCVNEIKEHFGVEN